MDRPLPNLSELEELLREAESRPTAYTHRPFLFSYWTFLGNDRELMRLLVAYSDDRQREHLWQDLHRLDAFLIEVSRRLHNYVASAMTLVDHTRRMFRSQYAGTPLEEEYEERKNSDFRDSPFSNFVQDLRDYAVHVDAPSLRGQRGGAGYGDILLDVIDTRHEWSPLAREFIGETDQRLVLRRVIADYTELVVNFVDWWRRRMDEASE